jgi:diaminopimelate epimerase
MQLVKFIKAHGLGNDFVIIPNFNKTINLSLQQVRTICDRKFGIGCDQLILLEHSLEADCKMSIYNSDGSAPEACGNATRCVALIQMNEQRRNDIKIEVNNNVLSIHRNHHNITVNMGKPDFTWNKIPLSQPLEELLANYFSPLPLPIAVNVGNPHAIFFVENLDEFDLQKLGPKIEHDKLFPSRVNVTIAKILDKNNISVKVWERGAGETLACGTAACATVAAAYHKKLVNNNVNILFKDRSLNINLLKDKSIEMTGEAHITFAGEYCLH